MAAVVEDGQFSEFVRYDWTLVLPKGEGLTLNYTDSFADHQQDNLTKPLQVAKFDGGSVTDVVLHRGSIKGFNIMTRRGVYHAKTADGVDFNPVIISIECATLSAELIRS